jgi:hypothetical protein
MEANATRADQNDDWNSNIVVWNRGGESHNFICQTPNRRILSYWESVKQNFSFIFSPFSFKRKARKVNLVKWALSERSELSSLCPIM